ncbi:MAG: allantoate amidohydrolase [Candidatus Nephthysia bennettiae]|nr:MAG: allantoate amidohydrolase [Candidatus Dormibacteraeota bacterium]
MSSIDAAELVLARCDELAGCTEEPGRLTRRFATPALREASELMAGWMRQAGMTVRRDAIGNVVGRREGGARTLLLGSHLDTVPDAGRFDGPLGVLVALAAIQGAQDLPFALEVYGFADEEGTRYATSYLASRVVAGRFDLALLERLDADGVSLADALRAFGGDPDGLSAARRAPDDLIGYCEVHIEQGPVLEARGTSLGVVTGIAGQSGVAMDFVGAAGHAGTVPMALRRDALAAAAEFVLAVEELGRSSDQLVATVGKLSVQPGAHNVIPGAATLSVDVRHLEDAVLMDAVERLHERATEIAQARRVGLRWQVRHAPAVACDPGLTELLAQAVGADAVRLPSGAGHDAAMMASICPVAMLFVRCADGISHHPDESVSVEDVAAAIDATTRFLRLVAPPGPLLQPDR